MKTPGQRSLIKSMDAGFTLIELMISVAILSIMLAISIPAYKGMIAEQKVRAVASLLHSSVLLARSEAIKRNRDVLVRPATGGGWKDGWLIPAPSTPNSDANPLLQERLSPSVTISGGPAFLELRASGRLKNASEVQFEIEANSDATKKRCVTVGIDGRVNTGVGGC